MERDQYWPCPEVGSCEESITENRAPIWTVDRAAAAPADRGLPHWFGLNGYTVSITGQQLLLNALQGR